MKEGTGIALGLCLGFLLGLLSVGWVWLYATNQLHAAHEQISAAEKAATDAEASKALMLHAFSELAARPISIEKDGRTGDITVTVPQRAEPIRFPAVCAPEAVL